MYDRRHTQLSPDHWGGRQDWGGGPSMNIKGLNVVGDDYITLIWSVASLIDFFCEIGLFVFWDRPNIVMGLFLYDSSQQCGSPAC